MKTFTADQFKNKYGEMGVAQFQQTPVQPKEPGYLSRVGSQIKSQWKEAVGSQTASMEGKMNPIAAGANLAKNATGIITAPLAQAPVFKQLGELFGKAGQAIVDTKPGQATTDWLAKQASPETLGAVSDTLETGLNVATIDGAVKGGTGLYNKAKSYVNEVKTPKTVTPEPPTSGTSPAQTSSTSANIMNRVARLKPTDATKFERVAGKTHGQYLAETKNFGAPDKVISNEAQKFTQSMNDVDSALAKLPGTYKSAPMGEALKGLVEKTKAQSSGNVKAPYYSQVVDLVKKYKSGGLTMEETNLLKRLYERNVKLGYNKLMNADAVARATNIDNQLRNWQFKQADTLGFKNIGEMNKQTQISKFIVDKLGDQVVGKNGLNSMGLTDWIMLSGGDPTSVAGFLTKKFFSSDAVQAKVAEMLANGDEAVGQIKPDIGQSKVPQLSAPKEGAPQSQNFTAPRMPTRSIPNEAPAKQIFNQNKMEYQKQLPGPSGKPLLYKNPDRIELGGKSEFENSAQTATRTSTNPKTGDNYVRDLKTGDMKYMPKNAKQNMPQSPEKVSGKSSTNRTTKFPNKQGGFINFGAIAKSIDNLDKSIMMDFLEGKNKGKATDLARAMGLESAFKNDQALKNDFIKILDAEREITKKKQK